MLQNCYMVGMVALACALARVPVCAISRVYTRVGKLQAAYTRANASCIYARGNELRAKIEGGISMVTYFYFYVSEEDLHAVMIQRDNEDGTFSVRPVSAYYREKTAREIVRKHNERIADRALPRAERKNPPPVRSNPPIEYRFYIPEWWSDRCPNWSHMDRVV